MISSAITSASGFTIVALRSFFHDLRIVRFYDLLHVFHAAVRNFQSESVEDLIKLAPPWKMPVYQAQEFGTYVCPDILTKRGVVPYNPPYTLPFSLISCHLLFFHVFYRILVTCVLEGLVVHRRSVLECFLVRRCFRYAFGYCFG